MRGYSQQGQAWAPHLHHHPRTPAPSRELGAPPTTWSSQGYAGLGFSSCQVPSYRPLARTTTSRLNKTTMNLPFPRKFFRVPFHVLAKFKIGKRPHYSNFKERGLLSSVTVHGKRHCLSYTPLSTPPPPPSFSFHFLPDSLSRAIFITAHFLTFLHQPWSCLWRWSNPGSSVWID